MKKFIVCLISCLLILSLNGCSSKNIKGFDEKFDFDMTDEQIRNTFSEYVVDYEDDDYVIFEDVSFDKNTIGDLRFNFNIEGNIDNFNFSSSDIDPEEIVNSLSKIYGKPVHSENYNDKRNHQANYVWEDKNVIIDLAIYPLNGEEILCSIQHYKNNDEFKKKRKNYLNNKSVIEDNIKNNKVLKDTYDTIISRSSLLKHPIVEAIEYGAGFDNYRFDDIYFREKIKIFDFNANAIYSIRNPEKDDLDSARFDGEIRNIKFEIDQNSSNLDLKTFISKFTELFGNDYIIDKSIYRWNNLPYKFYIKQDENKLVINVSNNYDIHLLDVSWNNTNTLETFENYDDCDIDALILENRYSPSTIESYSNAVNLTTLDLEREIYFYGRFYSYRGLDLLAEDCEWIDEPYNTEGIANQGAIYRKLAMCLEGFDMGNNYDNYIGFIVENAPSSSEFKSSVEELKSFITIKDSKTSVLKKFSTLNSVDGEFDFNNNSFDFKINDLTKCADELKISEEMLGYILAMLEEYSPNTSFNGNTYSFKLN